MVRPEWMAAAALPAAALLAATLGACDSDATAPSAPLDPFPLAVGNTWTYAPEDPWYGGPMVWRVTDRRGDTVTLARPVDDGSHRGTVVLLDRGDSLDLWLTAEGFAPFRRFTPGASWTGRDHWSCDDGAALTVVEETEPITTPAGVFPHCLRVERRTTTPCDDAGTMMEWWAPGVGLVRWDELNFYAGGPLTYHLVSYAVD